MQVIMMKKVMSGQQLLIFMKLMKHYIWMNSFAYAVEIAYVKKHSNA